MLDTATYTPRLKIAFAGTVKAALKEEFGYKNDMQVQPSSHEKTTLLAATETKNAQKTSAF